MHLLKEDGFTIIETLTAVVLLGITVVFTVIVFNTLFFNHKLNSRLEAIRFAENEMDFTIQNKIFTDTSYFTPKGNLKVIRKIKSEEKLYNICVEIRTVSNNKELLNLSLLQRK
ncbi:MAG: prepilin-type N-terminal cleavage/methylation domain-containing protein [Bacteroidota bacterium]|nr:prepilin-type N-terminal cleavage/methylation domain-containing protein [Bacteroidota bacterium]